MIETSRRSFLTGALALVTAPAIIRIENLMPVKPMLPEPVVWSIGINQRASYRWVAVPGYEIIDGVDKVIELNIFPGWPRESDAMRHIEISRGADGRLIVPRDVYQTAITPEGTVYTKWNGQKLETNL